MTYLPNWKETKGLNALTISDGDWDGSSETKNVGVAEGMRDSITEGENVGISVEGGEDGRFVESMVG